MLRHLGFVITFPFPSHFADFSTTDWINTRTRSLPPSTRSSLTVKSERPTWEENRTLPTVSFFILFRFVRGLSDFVAVTHAIIKALV